MSQALNDQRPDAPAWRRVPLDREEDQTAAEQVLRAHLADLDDGCKQWPPQVARVWHRVVGLLDAVLVPGAVAGLAASGPGVIVVE